MSPVTLFTGQGADLPLKTLLSKAKAFGYDGVEPACWGDHLEISRANDAYYAARKDLLCCHGLRCDAISAHSPLHWEMENRSSKLDILLTAAGLGAA